MNTEDRDAGAAQAAYDEATKPALAACNEATSTARDAYADAIRAAVPVCPVAEPGGAA